MINTHCRERSHNKAGNNTTSYNRFIGKLEFATGQTRPTLRFCTVTKQWMCSKYSYNERDEMILTVQNAASVDNSCSPRRHYFQVEVPRWHTTMLKCCRHAISSLTTVCIFVIAHKLRKLSKLTCFSFVGNLAAAAHLPSKTESQRRHLSVAYRTRRKNNWSPRHASFRLTVSARTGHTNRVYICTRFRYFKCTYECIISMTSKTNTECFCR